MKDRLPAPPAQRPSTDPPGGGASPLLAAVAAPAALAAIPAALGAAPAIATDAVCLRPSQKPNRDAVSPPLRMTGVGFTPGQVVPIQVGSRTWYTVVEDIGAFLVEIDVSDRLRLPRPKSSPLGIVATDPVLGRATRCDRHRAAGVLRDGRTRPVQHT